MRKLEFMALSQSKKENLHHEIEYVDGLKFDRGYVSPYFVTDDKKQRSNSKTVIS